MLSTLIKLTLLVVFLTSGELLASYKKHPAPWHSVLKESPATYELVKLFRVYQAYDGDLPLQLRRIGKLYDGGYVVPELAMQEADFIFGYGISNDISFEDSATALYGKPSFGFDCTCPAVLPQQKECHFIPSCIVGKHSPKHFPLSGTFEEHIRLAGAMGKKLFIKMDIEGDEYATMPDILDYAPNITGIVLEIHFMESKQIVQALRLLQALNRDFLLVHVHGNNCCRDAFITRNAKGTISRIVELSYINRNLVQRYEVSSNQTHPTSLDMPNSTDREDVVFTILE